MIYAWGDNELATLGTGETSRVKTRPVEVLPTWGEVVQVGASASHTTGFFADGHAEVVGGNLYDAACDGQPHKTRPNPLLVPVAIGVPPARAFSMIEASGAVILPDGSVCTWGGNDLGQLGNGEWSEGAERLDPPGVAMTPQKPVLPKPLKAIGGGTYHKLALTGEGQVVAWGGNDSGQLGDGTHHVKLAPVLLAHMTQACVAIAGGKRHSLALRADGTVLGWGQAKHGQFGTLEGPNVLHPTLVPGLTGIKALDAGGGYSLFLDAEGRVFQTGHGLVLHQVDLPGPCTTISQGDVHALAVCDGEVFAWGQNEYGQIGDGTRTKIAGGVITVDHDKPSPVPLGIKAVEVSAGVIHSVARA